MRNPRLFKKINKNNWDRRFGGRLAAVLDIAINRNKPSKSRMLWLFLINLAAGDGKS
jgi:hypothetical protein